MTFLASIVVQLLEWLLTKIFQVIGKDFAEYQANKKADKDAKNSAQPLKDAKTGAEIDKATDAALDHI